jgi:hypothetical protein
MRLKYVIFEAKSVLSDGEWSSSKSACIAACSPGSAQIHPRMRPVRSAEFSKKVPEVNVREIDMLPSELSVLWSRVLGVIPSD